MQYWLLARQELVKELRKKGIEDERILNAFLNVPRELFIPKIYHPLAYQDVPISIYPDITTSAPSTIAFMLQNLLLEKDSRVLEIGTGSGYQTALLSLLSKQVFSIERIRDLGMEAKSRLRSLGIRNVRFKFGDGFFGWEEEKPFDRMVISAAVEAVPPPLLSQLKDGGRIIYPVKKGETQFIYLCIKLGDKLKLRPLREVKFSPLRRDDGA